MKQIIKKLGEQRPLTRTEAAEAMRLIMSGEASDAQIAGLLMALKVRGEHPDEILGFVEVMREKASKISIRDEDAIDLCGTGGDGAGTFNISTVTSFVVAGAGVTVAKHGNRSISSSSGSADVIRALGVNIELSNQQTAECIDEIGIGFLFAPLFHPAMKYAAKTRTDLGVKTCFNMLGPLTNPASVQRQLVGVFNLDAAAKIAHVFSRLPHKRIFVVYSHDGLDEVSLSAPTSVFEVNGGGSPKEYEIRPEEFGFSAISPSALRGGSADVNAAITLEILLGQRTPARDVVLANAAFGLLASGKAASVKDGVGMAQESIDSGAAMKKLNQLREFSHR